MDTQKVVFMNKELGLRLAGLLRIPEGFDLSKNYPAIVSLLRCFLSRSRRSLSTPRG